MGRKFQNMQTEEQRYAARQNNSRPTYQMQETEPTDFATAARNSQLRAEAKERAKREAKQQAKQERRAKRSWSIF